MSRTTNSGSHRKVDTAKHRKRVKKERASRASNKIVRREADFAERIKPRTDAPLVCPLCNQPLNAQDQKGNIHKVKLGHKEVQVHRTCPGE